PSVEEWAILLMEAQDCVKKNPLFKMRNSSSETLFQAHDQSIQSLEQGCPSVEEHTNLFMEAQDRPSVEEQTILIMEAQDRPSVEERAILFMEAQDRVKKKPLFKMRPSVKEQTILFMEAQDRMKKGLYSKWHNSVSDTRFKAHDQPIRSLEREEVLCKNVSLVNAAPSVKEQTILFMEA
ncbi:hypothetical protein Tco_0783115, partial [Tanacetum coccineum]